MYQISKRVLKTIINWNTSACTYLDGSTLTELGSFNVAMAMGTDLSCSAGMPDATGAVPTVRKYSMSVAVLDEVLTKYNTNEEHMI